MVVLQVLGRREWERPLSGYGVSFRGDEWMELGGAQNTENALTVTRILPQK